MAKARISTNQARAKKSSTVKTKRNQADYPALDPHLNLRTRQDLIDYDYLHKLNQEELSWLNKFTEEYTNASLDYDNPRKNLHKTKKLRKDCLDRNNARNRCILTQQKAMGRLDFLDELKEKPVNPENEINTKLDLQKKGYLTRDGQIRKKSK